MCACVCFVKMHVIVAYGLIVVDFIGRFKPTFFLYTGKISSVAFEPVCNV